MADKMTLRVCELFEVIKVIENNDLHENDPIALVKNAGSGIGYTLEVEFSFGPRTRTIVEITGVEDW